MEVMADQSTQFGACVSDLDTFSRSFGYRFYRDMGERSLPNDCHLKTELLSLDLGGRFMDILALPEITGWYVFRGAARRLLDQQRAGG